MDYIIPAGILERWINHGLDYPSPTSDRLVRETRASVRPAPPEPPRAAPGPPKGEADAGG